MELKDITIQPLNSSGIVLLLRLENSIWHKWVNFQSVTYFLADNEFKSITLQPLNSNGNGPLVKAGKFHLI